MKKPMEDKIEKPKVKYELIKKEEFNYGKSSFLEVAVKRAVDESMTTNEYMIISKGFFFPQNNIKTYRKNISFPRNKEVAEKLCKAIMNMVQEEV